MSLFSSLFRVPASAASGISRSHRLRLWGSCFFLLSWLAWASGCGGEPQENSPPPPQGRQAAVEESDLYRIQQNRLYNLNTYKGLTIFDINDPAKPRKLSMLPVFGIPVEMFIDGDVAYVLVREALFLSQVEGKFEFRRYKVSQLITINIANPSQPKILQRMDLQGQLRDGTSRKVGKVLYITSYKPGGPTSYWAGTKPTGPQVTVYAYDMTNPSQIREVQALDLIQEKTDFSDKALLDIPPEQAGNIEPPLQVEPKHAMQGVTIAATANTLLVAENWVASYSQGCQGATRYNTRLNVVDISDPGGRIRVHSRFQLRGRLGDQFKQTYRYDAKTKRATYFGVYLRTDTSDADKGRWRNTLFAIDLTQGDKPSIRSALTFGNKNETVRGTLFDRERQVLYAITAERTDPLYAIDISDPDKPTIKSQIDGLSGDISLFRPIEKGQFLLAVGNDTSDGCTGFDPTLRDDPRFRNRVAVSIIDVRQLDQIKLVQRKCVDFKGGGNTSASQVNQNLDQAHKIISLYTDDKVNLLALPFFYNKRINRNGLSWLTYQSAIGLVEWDLSTYLKNKSKTVLRNAATLDHGRGLAKRTIIFRQKRGKSEQRLLLNLTDTNFSLFDIDSARQPKSLAQVELAPYVGAVYRFGDYVVEHVTQGLVYGSIYNHNFSQFRVKKLGQGDLNEAEVVATYDASQLVSVLRWKQFLVLFTNSRVSLVDFSNPRNPTTRGNTFLPYGQAPRLPFYLGGFNQTFQLRSGRYTVYSRYRWISTSKGLVFLTRDSKIKDSQNVYNSGRMLFFDFSNPDRPTQKEVRGDWNPYSTELVPVDDDLFFLVEFNRQSPKGQHKLRQWDRGAQGWTQRGGFFLPGPLFRAWRDGTTLRMLVGDINQQQLSLYSMTTNSLLPVETGFFSLKGWMLHDVLRHKDTIFMTMTQQSSDGKQTNPSRYLAVLGFDTQGRFLQRYIGDTRSTNLQLVGLHQNLLFFYLRGEGLLTANVSQSSRPVAFHFHRTLGWATHIAFDQSRAVLAAGHFGLSTFDLTRPSITIK